MKMRIRISTFVLMLAIGTTHSFGSDRQPSPEAMAADALIGRPLCFAATVLGAAMFVVALPVAAITKSVNKTAKTLVGTPADATFRRPLGEFASLE